MAVLIAPLYLTVLLGKEKGNFHAPTYDDLSRNN